MDTQIAPQSYQPFSVVVVMPRPGPLGRLIQRQRTTQGLTQEQLSDLTAACGVGEAVPQNQISRLESGKVQSIQEPKRLQALANVLGLESDIEFILTAYAPPGTLDRFRQLVQQGRAETGHAPQAADEEGFATLDTRTREYIRRYASLPPEERRYIEGAIDFTRHGALSNTNDKTRLKN